MHPTHHPTVSAADTDEMVLVTPADILRGAARYLEAHGWHQGTYYGSTPNDPFPPACADGAIGMAAYGRKAGFPGETEDPAYRNYNRARDYFEGYLQLADHRPPCDPWCPGGEDCLCDIDDTEIVFGWNDDDTRTATDVITALRAAADDYDRTHGGTR